MKVEPEILGRKSLFSFGISGLGKLGNYQTSLSIYKLK